MDSERKDGLFLEACRRSSRVRGLSVWAAYLTEEDGIVEEQASLGSDREHKLDLGASCWRQEG
jgi:hypothetical protein